MSDHDKQFQHTVTEVARGAELTAETIRLYADTGLIESTRLANGTRLFRADAVEKARALAVSRMANRGRRKA